MHSKNISLGLDFSSNDLVIVIKYENGLSIGSLIAENLSQNLLLNLNNIFQKNNIDKKDLINIYCGVGPSKSFTSLRVGISIVNSIAYALNIPIFPISSLSLIAEDYKNDSDKLNIIIKAQNNKSYFAKYYIHNNEVVLIGKEILSENYNIIDVIEKDALIITDDRSVLPNLISNNYELFSGMTCNALLNVMSTPKQLNIPINIINPNYIFNPFNKLS